MGRIGAQQEQREGESGDQAAFVCRCHWSFSLEGLVKICSIESSKSSAILKARGSEGSYRPVSIAFTLWRETSSRSARSPWLQSRSARSTLRRFFMPHLALPG